MITIIENYVFPFNSKAIVGVLITSSPQQLQRCIRSVRCYLISCITAMALNGFYQCAVWTGGTACLLRR